MSYECVEIFPNAETFLDRHQVDQTVFCDAVQIDSDEYEDEIQNLFPDDDEYVEIDERNLAWKGTVEYREIKEKQEQERIQIEQKKKEKADMVRRVKKVRKEQKIQWKKAKRRREAVRNTKEQARGDPNKMYKAKLGHLDIQLNTVKNMIKDVQDAHNSRVREVDDVPKSSPDPVDNARLSEEPKSDKQELNGIVLDSPSEASADDNTRDSSVTMCETKVSLNDTIEEGQSKHPPEHQNKVEQVPTEDSEVASIAVLEARLRDIDTRLIALLGQVEAQLPNCSPVNKITKLPSQLDNTRADLTENHDPTKQEQDDVDLNTQSEALVEDLEDVEVEESETQEPTDKKEKKKRFRKLRKRMSRIGNFFSRAFVCGKRED